jgi:cell division protein FtsI/penicillin-binding protein 2
MERKTILVCALFLVIIFGAVYLHIKRHSIYRQEENGWQESVNKTSIYDRGENSDE